MFRQLAVVTLFATAIFIPHLACAAEMQFNRDIYFAQHEANFGIPSDSQRAGLDALLGFIETDPALTLDANFTHLRWAAYILATIRLETGEAYQPVPEGWDLSYNDVCSIRCDRGPYTATSQQDYFNFWYSGVNGNGDYASGDGYLYRGRGYVQITGRGNYAALGMALGIDLVNNPDLALDPATAYQIISYGMRTGAFGPHGLDYYITDTTTDYLNARRTVNGTNQAQAVADAAMLFEAILRASLVVTFNQRPSDPITTPSGTQSGNVTISYSLQDAESDMCSILVEWSPNAGSVWYTATAGSGGNGTATLTSSPSGTAHMFVWASGNDIVNTNNTNVKFRITPADAGGGGTAGTTSAFTVNNSLTMLTISDASVRTNQFGFTITGPSNVMIVVQACSNLTNPIWSPVSTNMLTGGASYFSDPQWTNYPARFYRLFTP